MDRAVSAGRRDLLIGGLAIDPRNPLRSMQQPGIRLGRAFWHYREARNRISEETGREVRTVGLLYNGVKGASPEAVEALEYVSHIWRQDADAVLHADDPVEANRLTAEIDWLTK